MLFVINNSAKPSMVSTYIAYIIDCVKPRTKSLWRQGKIRRNAIYVSTIFQPGTNTRKVIEIHDLNTHPGWRIYKKKILIFPLAFICSMLCRNLPERLHTIKVGRLRNPPALNPEPRQEAHSRVLWKKRNPPPGCYGEAAK